MTTNRLDKTRARVDRLTGRRAARPYLRDIPALDDARVQIRLVLQVPQREVVPPRVWPDWIWEPRP